MIKYINRANIYIYIYIFIYIYIYIPFIEQNKLLEKYIKI